MCPTEAFSGMAETDDGAILYYQVRGSGPPLIFVHGWAMSGNFWKKQVEAFSGNYRVITIDLRAHGNSSKIMHGHTIPRYAGDVRMVMRKLHVENSTLLGWSLGGPVVLSYWEQFGAEGVRALGLVDMTPFPFSPADWNSHGMKNYDYNNMNAFLLALAENRREATAVFIDRMFRSGQAGPELEWMLAESLKTPTAAAIAIYSDYLMRDYSEILKTIDIPVVIFASNSQIFPRSIEMAKYVSSKIPNSILVPVENAGHLLFYENSEKFNSALTDFLSGLR